MASRAASPDENAFAAIAEDARLEACALAAAEGSRMAMGELYELFAPTLYAYAGAHGRDLGDEEDLTHDIFLAIHAALPQYKPERSVSFRAWALRVARNDLYDLARKKKRRPALQTSADQLEEVAATVEDPVGVAVRDDERRRLWQSVDCLRPAYRDVLRCRYGAALSVTETAEVLGKSEGTVKVTQHRALRALRRQLEAKT